MLSLSRPRFRAEDVELAVREHYGIEVSVVAELPSERDQNFHLRDSSGTELVFKIASATESRSVLDLQSQALEHVLRRDPDLPLPRMRRTAAGESLASLSDGDGASHFVRLFDFLPGRPLTAVRHHPESLLRGVGRLIGRLDTA
ncbi:MAG: phosphotransferase, partial [Vicinamibacteria bacterium]